MQQGSVTFWFRGGKAAPKSHPEFSMPNMTGRPGYRTMEMSGGSSAPYLACTPCVPLFCTSFNRGGNRGAFSRLGTGGGSFPLYGGTFAWSYSVSKLFKSSSEQVFLNNLRWVPDSFHKAAGRSSCELFKKVRANAVFLLACLDFGWGLGL